MTAFSPELLRDLPLFKDMLPGYLPTVAALLNPRKVGAGEVLMRAGEQGEEIVILLFGNVKVCVSDGCGSDAVVAIGGPGDVFGEMSVVDGQLRSATVIAMDECGLFQIDCLDFWNTLWTIPPVPYNMVCLLNRRMRFLTGQVHALRHHSPLVRATRQLAFLLEQLGLSTPTGLGLYLPFRIPEEDFASLAGVSVGEIAAAVNRWRELGLVHRDAHGRFGARSLEALRQLNG